MKLQVCHAFEPKNPEDLESCEDDYFVDEKRNVYCVLDGMGGIGHDDAKFSSHAVKRGVMKIIRELENEKKTDLYMTKLHYALLQLNENLREEVSQKSRLLGTTCSLARIVNGFLQYVFIGDSPISLYHPESKKMERLGVVDNYFLKELIRKGVVDEEGANALDNYEYNSSLPIPFKKHPYSILRDIEKFIFKIGYESPMHYVIKYQELLDWSNTKEIENQLWKFLKDYHKKSEEVGVHLTYVKDEPVTCETLEQFRKAMDDNPENMLPLIRHFTGGGFYMDELEKCMSEWFPGKKNQKFYDQLLKDIIDIYFALRATLDNSMGITSMYLTQGEKKLHKGDIILIESDGTSDILTDKEKQKVIESCLKQDSFSDIAQEIINAANKKQKDIDEKKVKSIRGKYRDDKTVIAVRL